MFSSSDSEGDPYQPVNISIGESDKLNLTMLSHQINDVDLSLNATFDVSFNVDFQVNDTISDLNTTFNVPQIQPSNSQTNDSILNTTFNISRTVSSQNATDAVSTHQNEAETQKENRKRKRARSELDKIKRNAEKHPILPPCSCKLNCAALITEERRKEINREFWSLTTENRTAWV